MSTPFLQSINSSPNKFLPQSLLLQNNTIPKNFYFGPKKKQNNLIVVAGDGSGHGGAASVVVEKQAIHFQAVASRGEFGVLEPGNHSLPQMGCEIPSVNDEERSVIELQNEHIENVIESTRNSMEVKIAVHDSQTTRKHRLPPLVSALKNSAEQNAASFHFPGHNRGRAAPSSLTQLIGVKPFLHDLPELPELDNLFSPNGPIFEAQREAAELFGASDTWFLVGGTTCGIQAAVMATCSPGDTLILPRNSHTSAISAMVLSGALPKYIIPHYDFTWDIAGGISMEQVDRAIKELEAEGQKPAAVFITSPTYHGICSNLNKISMLCHSHNIPLIIDEAHGAHCGFHAHLPSSSLSQGADLVVQSTHKVLCSLTQSSMLHMSGNIVDREKICRCLQTLQSTSPSNLLLSSLDAARAQLSENPHTIFNTALNLAAEAKTLINDIPGVSVLDFPIFSSFSAIDPLRITVGVWELGLSGFEADDILYKEFGVVSELVGMRSITFVITLGTCREHIQRLVSGLRHISGIFSLTGREARADDTQQFSCSFEDINIRLSPREAFFANKRRVSVGESVGEICGELICPYPPGIPSMIPGEIITRSSLDYLLQERSKGAVITGASDPLLSSILVCDS